MFYEWFINRSVLSGSLYYELPVTSASAYPEERSIGFTDARCLAFTEHYDVRDNNRRLLTLTLVPEEVTLDEINVKHL